MNKSKEEVINEKKFMEILGQMRPDLWGIEIYRQELGFQDIDWLRNVMRAVFNITTGIAFGDIRISIRNGRIISIKTSEIEILRE